MSHSFPAAGPISSIARPAQELSGPRRHRSGPMALCAAGVVLSLAAPRVMPAQQLPGRNGTTPAEQPAADHRTAPLHQPTAGTGTAPQQQPNTGAAAAAPRPQTVPNRPAAAGPPASAPAADAGSAPPFIHEQWTVRDGLPVNGITRIIQGHDGYLWLATWDGLVRFDGVRFTAFNTGNTPALPSNRLTSLIEDGRGRLWILTEQNHLVRLAEGEFTHFDGHRGVRDGTARIVYADPVGGMWVGATDGVHRLDDERFVPIAQGDVRGPIGSLLLDAAGGLLVGTLDQGLYRVQDGRATRLGPAETLRSTAVTALFEDVHGDVWVGTDTGLHRLGEGTITRVFRDDGRVLDDVVWDISAAPDGTIWVAAEEGLYTIDGGRAFPVVETPGEITMPRVGFDETGVAWYSVDRRLYRAGRPVFEVPLAGPGGAPSASEIELFVRDHEGTLWIATRRSGVFRLKPGLFRVYSDLEGVAHRNVAVVLEDRTGAVWAGTYGGGLSRIAADGVASYTWDSGFPAFITSLLQDRRGDLWVGTLRLGIRHCRLPAMACGAPPGGQPVPGAIVTALHEAADATIWAGTDRGLFRLVDGAWQRVNGTDGRPLTSVVRVFLEARDGTLWMGTSGIGVLAYRYGRLSQIGAAAGLPGEVIRSLHEDGAGRIWVGTEGRGLARFTPSPGAGGTVSAVDVGVVSERDGLFDNVVHAILADGFGRLWLSGNRGIYWVGARELDAFLEGHAPLIHSTAYTERDGLRNREANGGHHPAGYRARDGRLWFATQDGAVVVDPASARLNPVPPPVRIERVAVRGRGVDAAAGRVVLRPGDRDFEIDYTALSFMSPENMQFRYRLDGLDHEWTDAGNRRTAFYTHVPPGAYRFHVVASNNDGVWNETGATLELHVEPYFRETRMATVLLAFVIGLIGLSGVGWRLRSLRRRERELTALVDTRTAELRRKEQQLEGQNARLAAQAATLEQLHDTRSRLFANLSHEFRTPLTLIMGPLRSLLDGRHGPLHDSAREQGDLMLRNAQRLLRLINQVLDLARLQAGAVEMDRRPHDLIAFARETTLGFAPLADRRGIALTFRSTLPELTLAFDGEHLEKVLLNLLSNALKFTPSGGSVGVSLGTAQLADGATVVEIAVRDSGVGIARAQLPHVFERFYQADASATRRYEGTGIGLALARELVELHGGEIRAESTPGAGSTFTVRIPLTGATAPDGSVSASRGSADDELHAGTETGGETGATAVAATGSTPHSRRDALAAAVSTCEEGQAPPAVPTAPAEDRTTVLVVDDNADVRAYVRSVLAASYRVIEAADGQAGLETAQASLPDLIVADVMMPELDGLALGRALKDDPMTDAIPVVLLTARATPEDQVAGLETGADAYLVKPFDAGVLEATVSGLLAQRRRLRDRFRQGEATSPAGTAADAPEPSALELLLRPIVLAHLTEPGFGPVALAATASLSYHQLYRWVRDELDASPSRFIRSVRVEAAAELLRSGAGTITEIAYSVGFESLSYFNRAFRERFGASPTDYLADPARASRH